MRRLFITEFIALYRGRTVGEARLVAVSAEPAIVRKVLDELMGESSEEDDGKYDGGRLLELARDKAK